MKQAFGDDALTCRRWRARSVVQMARCCREPARCRSAPAGTGNGHGHESRNHQSQEQGDPAQARSLSEELAIRWPEEVG